MLEERWNRSFKSWLLRSTCKNVSMLPRQSLPAFPTHNALLLRLAVCLGTQSLKLIGYVSGLFLIPYFFSFLCSESAEQATAPEREKHGEIRVLCQSQPPSFFYDSLPSRFFFFRSPPQPAIHRLHRPNLLDLF